MGAAGGRLPMASSVTRDKSNTRTDAKAVRCLSIQFTIECGNATSNKTKGGNIVGCTSNIT